ncbi:hypothetical protein L1887_09323 [Cichorium endivia]|nr:hypothetical protein L1887_09323 [Cichorium endivia]
MGAVLATELKNNANKIAKWTAQAILASADMMKLGYLQFALTFMFSLLRVHAEELYRSTRRDVKHYIGNDRLHQTASDTTGILHPPLTPSDYSSSLPDPLFSMPKL